MNIEHEQLLDFQIKAQKLFINTFENFRESTRMLNRQKDENVFQLRAAKFVSTLKRQLESIALESINKNRTLKNSDRLNEMLTDQVKSYLNEFRRKSRSV